MSGIPSTTALFKVGKQASKGTPATADLICGMVEMSGLNPRFDNLDDTAEHGCRPTGVDRATAKKSQTRRGSYLATGSLRSAFYPNLIGLLMLGAGFKATTGAAGTNEFQTITLGGSPTGGTFTLSYGGQTTDPALAYNVSAADMQTALRALSSINGANVTVAGSAGGPYTVTFIGALAGTNVSAITANGAGLTTGENETVTVTLTGSPTGGDFELTFAGQETAAIAFDASAATFETAFEALSTVGAGNGTVSGSAGGPWTITFTGALAKRTSAPSP